MSDMYRYVKQGSSWHTANICKQSEQIRTSYFDVMELFHTFFTWCRHLRNATSSRSPELSGMDSISQQTWAPEGFQVLPRSFRLNDISIHIISWIWSISKHCEKRFSDVLIATFKHITHTLQARALPCLDYATGSLVSGCGKVIAFSPSKPHWRNQISLRRSPRVLVNSVAAGVAFFP